jgi:aminoglycoside phosphotransferase (APT) family kinase protein
VLTPIIAGLPVLASAVVVLGTFPVSLAVCLGEAIGTYHQTVTLSAVNHADAALFPRTVPWILSAHRHDQAPPQSLVRANQQILAIIHQYADFHKHLDALHEAWQFDTFIHGDMKWENCIVHPVNGEPQVRIVDWETADFGDACWDLGAIFQAYLTYWIMSIPVQGKLPPFEYVSKAPFPLEAMQPALGAFWLAYVRTRGIAETEQAEMLQRSMNYGAARMLQTAFEYMYYSPQITANALSLLQVSLNILSDTGNAVQDLLNL